LLIELLRAAAERPDHPFLLGAHRGLTYGECLAASEEVGGGIHRAGLERFAIVLGDPFAIPALLCGASAAGAEPCVYPAALADAGIAEYAAAFDHHTVVTDRDLALDGIDVVRPTDLLAGGGPPPAPARAPVLILTTGTTGRPKGVRHDWARLARRLRDTVPEPDARWLLAYNLNQFAGIQMLLHVLATQATLVVPASNRPQDAVGVLADLGVTHASATPTFWRVAAGMLDEAQAAEIPLRQVTLGGEAVPAAVLEQLRRLFPEARVSQVYASTEFGSSASVRDGRNGLPASVLERGEDAPVQFRVVDGELHTKSRVGMLGYYGEPDVDDVWRPTGDLVEVRGDRIHFVGRTSEVINVGGVKVHPLPVEDVVSAVEGVELAHVYGRANPVSGEIVAVDVVARPGADEESLEDAIRAACAALPQAARPRRIRFVDDVVRQQKIDRRKATE
jgi:acyl-CoA synthetase (AMP-forming)/AMP-acid ligase II